MEVTESTAYGKRNAKVYTGDDYMQLWVLGNEYTKYLEHSYKDADETPTWKKKGDAEQEMSRAVTLARQAVDSEYITVPTMNMPPVELPSGSEPTGAERNAVEINTSYMYPNWDLGEDDVALLVRHHRLEAAGRKAWEMQHQFAEKPGDTATKKKQKSEIRKAWAEYGKRVERVTDRLQDQIEDAVMASGGYDDDDDDDDSPPAFTPVASPPAPEVKTISSKSGSKGGVSTPVVKEKKPRSRAKAAEQPKAPAPRKRSMAAAAKDKKGEGKASKVNITVR